MGQGLGQGRKYVWICGTIVTGACLWVTGHLLAAPQSHPAAAKPAASASRPDILFVQTQLFLPGPLAGRFPKGSRIVLLKTTKPDSAPVSLTDGLFAAADPQVDFDATKILFSAQKYHGERWQLWEMDLNGANKRQITQCTEDCLRGAYLPADEIAFTVEASRDDNPSYLAVVKTDGSQLRRITFGPADFQLETVLRDGRIVASAPWPLYQDTPGRILYTLRPDGTALESLRCEHGDENIQADASELSDGAIVLVRTKENATGGELMQLQRGSAAATPLAAGHRAVYESPRELSPSELLVARASSNVANSQQRFDLYAVRAKTGALSERIFADTKLSSIQPLPVLPHDVPKHFWSNLDPESASGYFISLNSYLSGDAPKGRVDKTIASVRVLTLNELDGRERILGEAPVESDGSFYVRVPANAPVRFILLDKKGGFIHEERGWVWTRPGEQRGCTGCHGDKNVAPENHWPMALKRFDTPIALGDTEHAPATSTAK